MYSLKASKLQICQWSNLHTKYPQKKRAMKMVSRNCMQAFMYILHACNKHIKE